MACLAAALADRPSGVVVLAGDAVLRWLELIDGFGGRTGSKQVQKRFVGLVKDAISVLAGRSSESCRSVVMRIDARPV